MEYTETIPTSAIQRKLAKFEIDLINNVVNMDMNNGKVLSVPLSVWWNNMPLAYRGYQKQIIKGSIALGAEIEESEIKGEVI